MSARVAVALVMLSACDNAHGVVVEVTNGSGDGTVELFVALQSEDCDAGSDCTITPPTAATPPARGKSVSSRRWLQTTHDPLIMMSLGERWLLEPEQGLSEQTIAALLAVQLDPAGQPVAWAIAHDIVVATDKKQIVKLELHPAANDIQLWKVGTTAGDALAPCAIVTSTAGGAEHESFSRAEDQDCDGANPECEKFGAFGSTPADENQLTCLVKPSLGSHACDVGGIGCVENVGMSCTSPSDPYCLPQSVCSNFGSCTAAMLGDACTTTVLRQSNVVHCAVPTNPMCSSFNVTLPLGGYVTPGGTSCAQVKDVKISALASPLKFDTSAILDPVTNSQLVTLGQLDPTTCTIPAQITVDPNAGIVSAALLDIELKSPTKHHVVPLAFDRIGTSGGCTEVTACVAMPPASSDTLYTCN